MKRLEPEVEREVRRLAAKGHKLRAGEALTNARSSRVWRVSERSPGSVSPCGGVTVAAGRVLCIALPIGLAGRLRASPVPRVLGSWRSCG